MWIESIDFEHFRNIECSKIFPCNGMNIIFGENGQGKTNLIEGIWLFTGCHSFRTHKNNELVNFNLSGDANLKIDCNTSYRKNEIMLTIGQKKSAYLNRVLLDTPRLLLGEFQSIVFSPHSLSLVSEGPDERRKFLDTAISLVYLRYAKRLSRYNAILNQRNALLKSIADGEANEDLLEPFDEQLAVTGADIILYRIKYTSLLCETAKYIYKDISNDREKFSVKYISDLNGISDDSKIIAQDYFVRLKALHRNDIFRGYTTLGPHRDDLYIEVNEKSARSFASQGQKRSCALGLKLAEAHVAEELIGDKPVILLDDVMSELDARRQSVILNHFEDWQIFVTCCDRLQIERLKKGKSFEAKCGSFTEV